MHTFIYTTKISYNNYVNKKSKFSISYHIEPCHLEQMLARLSHKTRDLAGEEVEI